MSPAQCAALRTNITHPIDSISPACAVSCCYSSCVWRLTAFSSDSDWRLSGRDACFYFLVTAQHVGACAWHVFTPQVPLCHSYLLASSQAKNISHRLLTLLYVPSTVLSVYTHDLIKMFSSENYVKSVVLSPFCRRRNGGLGELRSCLRSLT